MASESHLPPNEAAPVLPPLEPASPSVVLDGVALPLLQFLAAMAWFHHAMFNLPLVVTSGKDGQHSPGSMHPEGRAADVRVAELSPLHQVLFIFVIIVFAVEWECRVFDERVGPGGPHVHIEYHGA